MKYLRKGLCFEVPCKAIGATRKVTSKVGSRRSETSSSPGTSRVNQMKVKEVKILVQKINRVNGANTIDIRGKVNGPELKQMLIAYFKSA